MDTAYDDEESVESLEGSEPHPRKKVFSRLVSAANNFMPKRVSDFMNCDRSFAHTRLWRPHEKHHVECLWEKHICCFVPCDEQESNEYGCSECLAVLRSDGTLLRFVISSTVIEDGKCRLISAKPLIHT